MPAVVLALCSMLLPASAQPIDVVAEDHPPSGGAALISPASQRMPADVRALLQWIARSGDNQDSNFIVIDKRQARMWLFDSRRKPVGNSAVLLGLAPGDISVPGIGDRAMSDISPQERITPAGRFAAEAGTNLSGEDIFWIDYDAAVSMHRLRPVSAAQRRVERMATPTPLDNRISWGCVNVPAAFYEHRLLPLFTPRPGLVYVLPETAPLGAFFAGASSAAQAPGPPSSRSARPVAAAH